MVIINAIITVIHFKQRTITCSCRPKIDLSTSVINTYTLGTVRLNGKQAEKQRAQGQASLAAARRNTLPLV